MSLLFDPSGLKEGALKKRGHIPGQQEEGEEGNGHGSRSQRHWGMGIGQTRKNELSKV